MKGSPFQTDVSRLMAGRLITNAKMEDHDNFSVLCWKFVVEAARHNVRILVGPIPKVVTLEQDGWTKVGLFTVSQDGQLHGLDFTDEAMKACLTSLAGARDNSTISLGLMMTLKFVWMQDQRRGFSETVGLSLRQRCTLLVNSEIKHSNDNGVEVWLGVDKCPTLVMKGFGMAVVSQRWDGGDWRCVGLNQSRLESFLEDLAERGPGYNGCWIGSDNNYQEPVHAHFQFVKFSIIP